MKVDTVDALKGIKIRTADKGAQDIWASAGMSPIVMPWGELLPALSSGAVSGVSTSAVSGVDGKFWEFLKFFYATNQQWSSDIVAINNDAWKKIKPEHQKAITDLATKLEPEFWECRLRRRQGLLQEDGRRRHAAHHAVAGDDRRPAQAHRSPARGLHEEGSVVAGAAQGLPRRGQARLMHGGPEPERGAPAFLRPLLDGIDMLSRLDGWLGVGCLVSLTSLMLAEVSCAPCRTSSSGCRRTFPSPGNTAPT